MHIGFLTPDYPPASQDGAGTFVQALARRLVAAGHAATVIGVWRIPRDRVEDDAGVRVLRLRASFLPAGRVLPDTLRLEAALRRLHRDHPFDLLEAAEAGFCGASRRDRIPRLIRLRGGHHRACRAAGVRPSPRTRRVARLVRHSLSAAWPHPPRSSAPRW